jgi:serpin B
MALGMVLNGANGDTHSDMLNALRFNGLIEQDINESYRSLIDLLVELDPRVEVGIANAIYAKETHGLVLSFAERVEQYFYAVVQNVSFSDPATLDLINGWVEDRTRGKIDKILDELPDLAVLLLNAVYFNGAWTTRFDRTKTFDGPFVRGDGSSITVPLMNHEEQEFPYVETETYRAGELPYAGAFRMIVVVPQGPTTVQDVVSELNDTEWNNLLSGMRPAKIAVLLPRFEIRYEELLNEHLIAMGMRRPFQYGADFSRMMPHLVCLSFVLQKMYVKVDEEGTTAAAITAVGGPDSLPPGIYATRPFLFAIREALSGTILFIGTVGDPTAKESAPADDPPVGCAG